MAQKRKPTEKPNILVIWGDDIGISNLSCYSDCLMGYRTPNIDRIANAEEEPELPDYPSVKDFPEFRKKYGPRGVLHCWSDGKGGQKIEDTGPLTKKRMETTCSTSSVSVTTRSSFTVRTTDPT